MAITYETKSYRDWSALYTAQKQDAWRRFGATSVFYPGRTDKAYPNLTGVHWSKLKSFWDPNFKAIDDKVRHDRWFTGFMVSPLLMSDAASRDAWKREYDTYLAATGWTTSLIVKGFGDAVLPEAISVGFWKATDPLILRAGGIWDSPRPWEVLAEALAESARNVLAAATPTIPTWMKWGAIGIGALWLTSMLTKGDRK